MNSSAPTSLALGERSSPQEVRKEHDRLSCHVCAGYFDFFPMPMVVLNSHRQIVYSNKAFFMSMGAQDVDGFLSLRPGEAMRCIYAEAGGSGCGTSGYCAECGALKALLEAMDGKCEATQDCQLLLRHGDETSARDLRVFAAPWNTEGGLYYVVSIVDVGDEKRRRLLERIFFHDILNSAGTASGLAEIINEQTPEEAREPVVLLRAALFSLVDEIHKQKQLLAIESGEYDVSPITLQALEMVSTVATEYAAHPAALGKAVRVEPGGEDLAVKADYTLLRRVLGNMAVNALEATPEGGEVRAGVRREGGRAMFWVRNDQAMPEQARLRIFKRSFSTKGRDRGLGTYSIKLLAENYLGGEVGFSSAEGQGTTFWVELPLAN